MGIDMQDDKNTHVSKCESVSHSVEFDSLQPHEMCSLSGSSVCRILQARILEWVAISLSRGSSWPRDQTQVSALQIDSLPSEPPGSPLQKQKQKNSWAKI